MGGEECLDPAGNRTTVHRLSSPQSSLYIDHAVMVLHIFRVLEKVLRSSEKKICEVSLTISP
jgi:hypothetical protein